MSRPAPRGPAPVVEVHPPADAGPGHSALNDRTPAEAYTDDGADGSLGLCPGSRQPKVA